MRIIDCNQNTPEWFSARAGVFSASEYGPYITGSGKTADTARLKYILQKIRDTQVKDAWEIQEEDKEEKAMSYNIAVQRGNALEPEAREWYEQHSGQIVTKIGFITDDAGNIGCSPDGMLVGDNEHPWSHGIEIKCPMPTTHLRRLLDGALPDEHKYQVHGSMAITGLNRWDYLSYCPGEAPLLITVRRDPFSGCICPVQ